MAFDVVMFGSLSLPERNVEEWLTTPLAVPGVELLHETPEALLTALKEVTCAPHELFRVELEGSRVTVQCYASEDTYRETSQLLTTLFASAAGFAGLGELYFSGYRGLRFGECLTVRGGHATSASLSAEALTQLEFHSAYAALEARIHQRFDSLVGRAPVGDARGARWVINPFTGRKVRVAADSEAR